MQKKCMNPICTLCGAFCHHSLISVNDISKYFNLKNLIVMKSRVRIIALHFVNCKVNSYYLDRNVSHSMKNAKQFFHFKINLIKRY